MRFDYGDEHWFRFRNTDICIHSSGFSLRWRTTVCSSRGWCERTSVLAWGSNVRSMWGSPHGTVSATSPSDITYCTEIESVHGVWYTHVRSTCGRSRCRENRSHEVLKPSISPPSSHWITKVFLVPRKCYVTRIVFDFPVLCAHDEVLRDRDTQYSNSIYDGLCMVNFVKHVAPLRARDTICYWINIELPPHFPVQKGFPARRNLMLRVIIMRS